MQLDIIRGSNEMHCGAEKQAHLNASQHLAPVLPLSFALCQLSWWQQHKHMSAVISLHKGPMVWTERAAHILMFPSHVRLCSNWLRNTREETEVRSGATLQHGARRSPPGHRGRLVRLACAPTPRGCGFTYTWLNQLIAAVSPCLIMLR